MFRDKKVLVTGGSGMIGRQLVKLLQEEFADVYIADLNEPLNMDNITFKRVDLTDYEKWYVDGAYQWDGSKLASSFPVSGKLLYRSSIQT